MTQKPKPTPTVQVDLPASFKGDFFSVVHGTRKLRFDNRNLMAFVGILLHSVASDHDIEVTITSVPRTISREK